MQELGRPNFSPELISQLMRYLQSSSQPYQTETLGQTPIAGNMSNISGATAGALKNQIPPNETGNPQDLMKMLRQLLGQGSGNPFYNPYMKGTDFGGGLSSVLQGKGSEILSLLKGLF